MKKIKVIVSSLLGALSLAPALAFAQTGTGNLPLSNLGALLDSVNTLMGRVVPILIGLAVIAFLWGVLRYVFNAGSEEKRTEGRKFMIYSIIGIVVMVSVWGLVIFVQQSFGLGSNGGHPAYPTV